MSSCRIRYLGLIFGLWSEPVTGSFRFAVPSKKESLVIHAALWEAVVVAPGGVSELVFGGWDEPDFCLGIETVFVVSDEYFAVPGGAENGTGIDWCGNCGKQ